MLKAQEDKYVKGDWFSDSQRTLKELDIDLTNFEIRKMSRAKFHKITKQKSEARAFRYLIEKQKSGKKGNALKYKEQLEMADYLHPNDKLSL